MKAELVKDLVASPRTVVPTVMDADGHRIVPKGTVIEGVAMRPWFYVQMGAAVPLDGECRMAAGLTEAQIDVQVKLYEAKRAGIQPEDMAAWQAGAMTGYDEEGDWIPGPKYTDWLAAHSSIILPGGDYDDDDD
ncbi:MAG: hypothetical protein WC277_07430 [Bacilli bacterium]